MFFEKPDDYQSSNIIMKSDMFRNFDACLRTYLCNKKNHEMNELQW